MRPVVARPVALDEPASRTAARRVMSAFRRAGRRLRTAGRLGRRAVAGCGWPRRCGGARRRRACAAGGGAGAGCAARAVGGGAVLGAAALEEHLAGLERDGLAVLAVLVVPFVPVELGVDEDARALGEVLRAGARLGAEDVDGRRSWSCRPTPRLGGGGVVKATRRRATSAPEGRARSSTSRVRLPDSWAVAMSRIGACSLQGWSDQPRLPDVLDRTWVSLVVGGGHAASLSRRLAAGRVGRR